MMKTIIVTMALTLTTLVIVLCAFAGCKSTGNTSSSLSSTISKVTSGTISSISSIIK